MPTKHYRALSHLDRRYLLQNGIKSVNISLNITKSMKEWIAQQSLIQQRQVSAIYRDALELYRQFLEPPSKAIREQIAEQIGNELHFSDGRILKLKECSQ